MPLQVDPSIVASLLSLLGVMIMKGKALIRIECMMSLDLLAVMHRLGVAGRRDSFGRRMEVFQSQVHSNPISTCNALPEVLPLIPRQLPDVCLSSQPFPTPQQNRSGIKPAEPYLTEHRLNTTALILHCLLKELHMQHIY